jgi:hypothetical protein
MESESMPVRTAEVIVLEELLSTTSSPSPGASAPSISIAAISGVSSLLQALEQQELNSPP